MTERVSERLYFSVCVVRVFFYCASLLRALNLEALRLQHFIYKIYNTVEGYRRLRESQTSPFSAGSYSAEKP